MTFSNKISSIVNSFQLVQNHYGIPSGRRVQHIIIGFADRDGVTQNGLDVIARQAAWFIGQRFQCCYGIHQGSENHRCYDHIHLAVNTVSYVDGKRYYETMQNLFELKEFLSQTTMGKFSWNVYMKESSPYVEGRMGTGFVYTERELIKSERL